jgi:hypothetical protein
VRPEPKATRAVLIGTVPDPTGRLHAAMVRTLVAEGPGSPTLATVLGRLKGRLRA